MCKSHLPFLLSLAFSLAWLDSNSERLSQASEAGAAVGSGRGPDSSENTDTITCD